MSAGTAAPITQEEIIRRLQERFGAAIISTDQHAGQGHVVVLRGDHLPVLEFLRNDPEMAMDYLCDVTAVDHLYLELPGIPERFTVVYQLLSLARGHRFRVKAAVPEGDPRIASVLPLWKAALWGERETHDMFGIEFDGNPDMRRLLMPADYIGFPLRKDYPLRGRGERESFGQYRKG